MGAPVVRAACIFVIAFLHFFNGQYYAAMAVANLAEVQERLKAGKIEAVQGHFAAGGPRKSAAQVSNGNTKFD